MAEQRVEQRLVREPQPAPPIVERDALFADQPSGARNVMIAQVFADAGQLMVYLDAEIAQAFRADRCRITPAIAAS